MAKNPSYFQSIFHLESTKENIRKAYLSTRGGGLIMAMNNRRGTCVNCGRENVVLFRGNLCGGVCYRAAAGLHGDERKAALAEAKAMVEAKGGIVGKPRGRYPAKPYERQKSQELRNILASIKIFQKTAELLSASVERAMERGTLR